MFPIDRWLIEQTINIENLQQQIKKYQKISEKYSDLSFNYSNYSNHIVLYSSMIFDTDKIDIIIDKDNNCISAVPFTKEFGKTVYYPFSFLIANCDFNEDCKIINLEILEDWEKRIKNNGFNNNLLFNKISAFLDANKEYNDE